MNTDVGRADGVSLLKQALVLINADPETAAMAPMLRYIIDNIEGRQHIMVDLERNCVVIDGRAIHLRAEAAEIMLILMRPGVHTYDLIIRKLYGAREEPADAKNVLDVTLTHLRRALTDSGFRVKTHWGTGLELVADTVVQPERT